MPSRRKLDFSTWDQVKSDLSQLSTSGYTATGKWNLGQIAKHLNDWITFPVLGFPKQPIAFRCIAFTLRHTAGPGMLRKILKEKSMASGSPTLATTVYTVTQNDADAVAELEKSIQRFQEFQGELHPSPLFGRMDKETAERLQLIHFSHHLSFLIPGSTGSN